MADTLAPPTADGGAAAAALRGDIHFSRPEVVADQGVVTSLHPLASEAGLAMLRRGGNAVDAAVATAFALGVVEPMMSGLGGRGALLIHLAEEGRQVVVDYNLRAPLAAHEAFYDLDDRLGVGSRFFRGTRDSAHLHGPRSIGTPGVVAGLCLAQRTYGRLDLPTVLEPAIAYAEDGFAVGWSEALYAAFGYDLLRQDAAASQVFLPSGRPPRQDADGEGDRWVQRDLAATLRRLAAEGPDLLYHGDLGARVAAHVQALGGALTVEDLAAYEVRHGPADARGSYRGLEVLAVPRDGAGTAIIEELHILAGFDLRALGPDHPTTLHLVAEAMRRGFADKVNYLGDPAFVDAPWRGLESPAYADEVRARIHLDRVSEPPDEADPWRFEGRARPSGPFRWRRVPSKSRGETTYLAVVDGARNAVSLTQTLAPLWGSGIMVPGTGVLLNAAMAGFNPEPGWPNSVGPGKRPAWSNSPMLLLRDGQAALVCGSPGSRRSHTSTLHTILNVAEFGMGIQEAVAAPRIHVESEITYVDERFSAAAVRDLERRGHRVQLQRVVLGGSTFGRPNGVLVDAAGRLHGGVTPFAQGLALGY